MEKVGHISVTHMKGDGAPAVVRALQLLELLAESGNAFRMSELSSRTGIPKASLHHVLAALIDAGWVERDVTTKEISLGLRAWEVGLAYESAQTLSQRAQPYMDTVRDELGETVRLAVLSGQDNVCVGKSQGHHTLVFDQRVGARLPAHATGLGKALLSQLRGEEITNLYSNYTFEPFTENTLVSLDALKTHLAAIRQRGWAEDVGELILGIHCIAVPVHSHDGRTVAALSVSVPSARFSELHQKLTLQHLSAAANSLAAHLGGEVTIA